MNLKNGSNNIKSSMVLDYERGSSEKIAKRPWQTDTCIEGWHYQKEPKGPWL